ASLVQRQTNPDEDPRFQLLETVRAFALEQADRERELRALQERHAAYVVSEIETANRYLLRGHELARWLSVLDDRLPNIRSALAWSAANDPLTLSRMTRLLMQYWL